MELGKFREVDFIRRLEAARDPESRVGRFSRRRERHPNNVVFEISGVGSSRGEQL